MSLVGTEEKPVGQENKNMLSIPNASGDNRIMWNPKKKAEVAVAKAAFEEATKPVREGGQGMTAYKVDEESGKPTREVIRHFNPKAGKIIMMKAPVGG